MSITEKAWERVELLRKYCDGYSDYECRADISELIGKTLVSVERESEIKDSLWFYTDSGDYYALHHLQDGIESVDIEDICGELSDLVGSPILMAEATSNDKVGSDAGVYQWTFYRLATVKGYVTIRWYGSRDSYASYSLEVDFVKLPRIEALDEQ